MAQVEATLTVRRKSVGAIGMRVYLKGVQERQRDVSRAWPLVRSIIFDHEEELFAAEGATSEHQAWEPLTPKYEAWKQKRYPGMRILQLSRGLMRQLTGGGGLYEVNLPRRYIFGSDRNIGSLGGGSFELGALHMTGRDWPPMPAREPIRVTDELAYDIAYPLFKLVFACKKVEQEP